MNVGNQEFKGIGQEHPDDTAYWESEEYSDGPAMEKSVGAAPQDMRQGRSKRSFMWLVYLHFAVSLVVAAIRINNILMVRRRRGHY